MKTLAGVIVACVMAPSLAHAQAAPRTPAYVGSAECRVCHTAVYDRWKKTRMATVVRDPKYLNTPWVTTSHFKKEPDGAKWAPAPCRVR